MDTYVTSDSGTGIVHQAPAFGEDDHRVSVANGVVRADEMPPCPIDDAGKFTKEVPDFAGQYVKVRQILIVNICTVLRSEMINSPHRLPTRRS